MNISKAIENYILTYLSKPNTRFGNNSQPCPFAKKALTENKIEILEIRDIKDFWSTVVEQCEKFTGDKDVVVIACNNSAILLQELIGGCDALNQLFSYQAKDLWLLSSENFANSMVLIQKLSELDDASKILEDKGYYNLYPKDSYQKHIVDRRKIRQKSTLKVDKNLNKQYTKQ